jgi:cephalosporin hydroxylase
MSGLNRVASALVRGYRRRRQALLRPPLSDQAGARAAAEFHRLFYERGLPGQTWYRGIRMIKCPLDLWMVRELIERLRPEFIIETGTYLGASALYYGELLDQQGQGQIITIDLHPMEHYVATGALTAPPRRHARARYLNGSSTSCEVIETVRSMVRPEASTLVFLDSDHAKRHVLAELRAYAPLVSRGSYVVVEDTNINGHPVKADFGPGPMEAVEVFLRSPEGRGFRPDPGCERYLLTMNPSGWLRRDA